MASANSDPDPGSTKRRRTIDENVNSKIREARKILSDVYEAARTTKEFVEKLAAAKVLIDDCYRQADAQLRRERRQARREQ